MDSGQLFGKEIKVSKNEPVLKLFMPLQKSADGRWQAVLSDSSTDRDDEAMSKELIQRWSMLDGALPTLVNHENRMESYAGLWQDKKFITSADGKHVALSAYLDLFEKNPHTRWLIDFVEEVKAKGGHVGVSISAIPKKYKEMDFKKTGLRRMWVDAELLEATVIPIQSNRNAHNFGYIAKRFNLAVRQSDTDEYDSEIYSNKMAKEAVHVEHRGSYVCTVYSGGPEKGRPVYCWDVIDLGFDGAKQRAEESAEMHNSWDKSPKITFLKQLNERLEELHSQVKTMAEDEKKKEDDAGKTGTPPADGPESPEEKSKEITGLKSQVAELTKAVSALVKAGEVKKPVESAEAKMPSRADLLLGRQEGATGQPKTPKVDLVEKSEYPLFDMLSASHGSFHLVR